MKEFERYYAADGVQVVCVPASRFKTNVISLSIALELKEETASRNALLIYLLSHCSADYENMTELNKRLAMLYGAHLGVSVSKLGEAQLLQLSISSLDDRFALDNEKISEESVKLLLSLLFRPRIDENGCFFDEDIEREKNLLIQRLEGENNEKRIYSLRRLEAEMFKGEPYAVNALGTVDGIRRITNKDLTEAHDYFINRAKIQITSVGSVGEAVILKNVKEYFSEGRDYKPLSETVFVPCAEDTETIKEEQSVKQGKLVLGFRVNMRPEDSNTDAMRAFCDVFGGGPYSKLFMNVREKLSLCYYCSARYYRRKSCIIIQCGCEEENMDKAVDEILRQLEDIKNGDFSSELEASKIGLSDSINSVYDDSEILLYWYSNQINDDEIVSPKDSADKNDAVTFEQIKNCAGLLSLDTVYKLVSKREGE